MGRGWERALLATVAVGALPSVFLVVAGLLLASPEMVLGGVALLPIVALVVWWRARRRRLGREALPDPPVVSPVPAPGLDDVADLKAPVSACMRCGYLGIRMPGIGDGLWPGGGETGARFVCPRCHYQGMPIEFATTDQYVAFVRELHAPQRQ